MSGGSGPETFRPNWRHLQLLPAKEARAILLHKSSSLSDEQFRRKSWEKSVLKEIIKHVNFETIYFMHLTQ